MLKALKLKSRSKKKAKGMAETSDEIVQPRDVEPVSGEGHDEDPEKQTKRDIFNEYMYVSCPGFLNA